MYLNVKDEYEEGEYNTSAVLLYSRLFYAYTCTDKKTVDRQDTAQCMVTGGRLAASATVTTRNDRKDGT